MVKVIVVEPVIDDEFESVPTIVNVYVPFAAFVELLDEDEEPQLESPNAKAASTTTAAYRGNFLVGYPSNTMSITTILVPVCARSAREKGWSSLSRFAYPPMNKLLPLPCFADPLEHVDLLVETVMNVVIALVPETVAFDIEKHAFVSEEGAVMLNEMAPV